MNKKNLKKAKVNTADQIVTTDTDVSVIVPVFNAAETLERAVCSILQQDASVQIILIDDASTDNSLEVIHEIIKNYSGNFTVVESDINGGVSCARNLGIAHATSKYMSFLDADDVWLPGKLEKQLNAIRARPDLALVSCDSFHIHPDGRVLSRNHDRHKTQNGRDAWKELLRQNFIPTPTVLTHTQLVRNHGGFNTLLTVGEDLDLWIKIAKSGCILVVPEVLVHYFDYSNSLMKRGGYDQEKHIMQMLEHHFNDERLSNTELNRLKSHRYIEMSKGLWRSNPKKMNELLDKALELGFSKSVINQIKFKRSIKRLLLRIKRA